jgi:predicted nuclease of predicted toxin-antitoxin system
MHSLKFLLDADMPRSSAKLIASLGYDIEDVRDTGLRSAKDEEIIKYALRNNRTIITRNVGFGSTLRARASGNPYIVLQNLYYK